MNNEEPQLTQIANLQISHEGHKLPEQSQVAETSIPRPFGFLDLISQWQPMGIRVVLNLPFIGNDQDFLFAIRNGPFIPRHDKAYTDLDLPDTTAGAGGPMIMLSYGWNNMRNVIHGKPVWAQKPTDTKEAVYITYYDYPPVLSSLSTMFRKWRGAMEYRIRVVSGFSTQGYLMAGMLRNVPSRVGVYNAYDVMASIPRQDHSYREFMQNSYVMSDTSMFRHFKIHAPYEYPSPWYDQFNWIANRSRPSRNFYYNGKTTGIQNSLPLMNEPHGDNYIVIGMRGSLNTSVNQAQISFELEYRAAEGFQFADPGLPIGDFMRPYLSTPIMGYNSKIVTIPAQGTIPTSDGLGVPRDETVRAARTAMAPAAPLTADLSGNVTPVVTNRMLPASISSRIAPASRRRAPRSVVDNEVEDEEYIDYDSDPAIPSPGKPLDHGPQEHPLTRLNNMRKSLYSGVGDSFSR